MNTLKKTAVSVLVLTLCSTAVMPVMAAGEAKTVRVAVLNYSNFLEREEDGTVSGYAAEYLSDIADYTGWRYQYIDMSFREALEKLHDGEIDIVAAAPKAPGDDELYDFSESSMGQNGAILCVDANDDRYAYQEAEAFEGLRVGALADSPYIELCKDYMTEKNINITITEYRTEEEAGTALETGQIDALMTEVIRYIDEFKVIARLTPTPMYFACNPGDPEIKAGVDAAQKHIHAANRYYEMTLDQKYFSDIQNSQAFSKSEQAYIESLKAINLGYVSTQDPVSYTDADTGEFAGMTRQIMDRISEISGLQFNYVPLPAGKISYDYLRQEQIGLISSVEYTGINLKTDGLRLSEPYLSAQKVFVGRSNFTFDKNAAHIVAMATGSGSVEAFLQTKYPNFKISAYDTIEDSFRAVVNGEADLLMQNQYVVTNLLSKPQYEALSAYPVEGLSDRLCLSAVSLITVEGQPEGFLSDPLLISILNKSIARISDDEVSQIVAKYTTGKPYRLTLQDTLYKYRIPFAVIAFLMVVCIGMFVLILMIRQRNMKKMEVKNRLLSEAALRADHANKAKSQFLARMSHEIRTPMNAIVGLTEIARHYSGEKEKTEDYLSKIDSSAKILLGIINDVLDMSAIESEKLKIAHNPFDLKALISSVSTLYYTQCKNKNIEFEVMLSGVTEERLIGDALRLNQILLNLLSNAYKFTPEYGKIKVIVLQENRAGEKVYFRFSVCDNGCGISEEMQTRIFRPFEQESASTALAHGGSGLGLSITKNLVEMMHGAIKVESKKEIGTTFTVELPFDVDSAAAQQDGSKLKDIRALIVDDDENTLKYTSIVLERIGVQFETASNGNDAIQLLSDAHRRGSGYDICFVDWKMPGKNGVDVTKKIRDLYDENTIIIIVSAYDLSEVEEEAKAAGANMFISKPLFQSTVYNVLMTLSGGKYTKLTADQAAYDFTGKRILLAEDNELNREIATDLLGMVNLKVDCAGDGKEALELFTVSAAGTYDAILMDIQMPVLDGYEAARRIRKSGHPQAKSIPIYAMTANAFSEDVSEAFSAGMNGHIAKPIDTAILYETLGKCFKAEQATLKN
ncbi:MAG: response regulator [Lachnospiraceae bacterium]|nr:response regulator [Lachnospiraceae bacterium]